VTRRIQNIQALRGVAVLLVMFVHLAGMEREFGGGERLLPALASAGRAGVDLFFVISGFVMVAVTSGAGRGPRAAAGFLYHRATRIYPAYWFYTGLLIGLHVLLPQYADPARWGTVSVARSLLLLPQKGTPILVVGWSMVHEIYFYLAFALFVLAPERRLGALLGCWLAAVVALPALLPGLPASPAAALLVNPLTVEFVAGAAIALLARRGALLPGRTALAAGAILLPCAYAALAPGGAAGQGWPEGWARVAVFGVPAVLMIAGAVSMEFSGGRLLPRPLQAIGDASYSIYLIQIFVVLALGRVWARVRLPGLADNAAAVALAAGAILAAGALSHRLLERPLLALARRLWPADPAKR
jgi:peptidoglycan/LPS O-acetylase OafA/YrhL